VQVRKRLLNELYINNQLSDYKKKKLLSIGI